MWALLAKDSFDNPVFWSVVDFCLEPSDFAVEGAEGNRGEISNGADGCLGRVTAKAGGKREGSTETKYIMKFVEVSYFVHYPSHEVVQRLLKTSRVQAMKASNLPGFRNSVFMATGIMTAKSLEFCKGRAIKSS